MMAFQQKVRIRKATVGAIAFRATGRGEPI